MKHEDQVAIGKTLLRYLDDKTTAMADAVYANDVSDYTCPKQAAAEREKFFRNGPINIGLSCLAPEPGDFMTHDYSGVPILLVRRQDGSLGAFLNVCRHRGAQVAQGCGNAKLFTCPYHAWSYDTSGKLRGRPDERSFAGYDKETIALRALPVVETHGMIWVASAPGPALDIDAQLGGLQRDLASYQLEGYHHYETRVLSQKLNWKIVIDTFLETYHLQFLHTNTVSPIIHSNTAAFDAFGPSLRMIAVRRTIEKLRDIPKDEWNLIPLIAGVYVLFPNTVFIMQGDHVETWHVYPSGDGINECTMRVSFYIPEPATTDKARQHWDRNFDLLMATVEKEDFPLAEGIQRGFHSPAQTAIHFGRNEPALQHFHKSVKQALGMEVGS
jgi:phenylpropionate dioxygenase-like ring-hydroxylating dioxygenase large terminal subunit